jgi:hypothetical protein
LDSGGQAFVLFGLAFHIEGHEEEAGGVCYCVLLQFVEGEAYLWGAFQEDDFAFADFDVAHFEAYLADDGDEVGGEGEVAYEGVGAVFGAVNDLQLLCAFEGGGWVCDEGEEGMGLSVGTVDEFPEFWVDGEPFCLCADFEVDFESVDL